MYAIKKPRKNAKKPTTLSEPKRKKTVLNLKQKEDVINSIEKQGLSIEKAASDNNMDISSIYKLLKTKQQLVEYRKNYPNSAIRKTLKLSAFPELEKALLIWFYQRRAENKPISQAILALKSKEFYDQIYKEKENVKPFKGSIGFVQKFCARNRIMTKNVYGESESSGPIDNGPIFFSYYAPL